MTVAFGAIGTGANGSTTVAPSYPSGITVGQLLICAVTSGATNSETPTTPSGWFLIGTNASTDGTFGLDTGPRRATLFGRVADGSESGTLTVSITNGNSCRGTISRFTSSVGKGWLVRGSGANDSTSGTGVSMTFGAMDWKVGDVVLVVTGQRVDSATQSSQSLTASGITFGSRTNQAATAVTTGNDHRHTVDTFAATTGGTGSQAATWAYTASAAASAGGVLVQIRELGNVDESFSLTAAQTESAADLHSAQAETITFAATQDPTVTTRSFNETLTGLPGHGALFVRRAAIGEAANTVFNKATPESITLTATQAEASTVNSASAESFTISATGDEASTLNSAQAESMALTAAQTGIAGRSGNRDEAIGFTAAQTESASLNSARGETVGLADDQTEASTVSSASAEAVTFTAAQVGSINSIFAKQRDESVAFSDTPNRTAAFARAAADAITFTATAFQPVERSFNEALVGFPGQGVARWVRANDASQSLRAETITFAAAQTETSSVSVARAESIGFTAAQANVGFNAARAETIGLSDTGAESSALNAAQAESLSLTAAQIGSTGSIKTVAESIGFTAAQAGSLAFSAARGEAVSLTDAQSISSFVLAPPRFNALLIGERRESLFQPWAMEAAFSVSRAESLSLSGAQSSLRTAASSRAELLGLSDAQTEQATFAKATAEAISLTASQDGSKGVLFVKQCEEAFGLTAAQSEVSSTGAARAESVAFSDSPAEALSTNAARAEAIGFTDVAGASMQPIYSKARDEAIGLTASQSANVNHSAFVKQAQEGIGFTAAQSQVPSLNAARTELILLNDAVAAASEFHAFMAETLGFGDASFIITGPFSEFYRYDVPGGAGDLHYDVPGSDGDLRFDFPGEALDFSP